MVNYTRLHEAIQLKSQPTHIRTLPAAEWLPCRLRYRPAVLFRHLRLTALSISKGKIQRAFKKLINFFFSFSPPVALRPNAGHGLLILEVSRSHTTMHHSR